MLIVEECLVGWDVLFKHSEGRDSLISYAGSVRYDLKERRHG